MSHWWHPCEGQDSRQRASGMQLLKSAPQMPAAPSQGTPAGGHRKHHTTVRQWGKQCRHPPCLENKALVVALLI